MEFFETSRPVWYALLILFLPLLGFCFNCFGFRTGIVKSKGHLVPMLCIGTSLLLSLHLFKIVVFDLDGKNPAVVAAHEAAAAEAGHDDGAEHGTDGHDEEGAEEAGDGEGHDDGHDAEHAQEQYDERFFYNSTAAGYSFDLIDTGGFQIVAGITIDNLTVLMLVVVCIVSFLVHMYSTGYMHGDKRYPRFFAFLGLFTFSMLGLILTDNLLLLFCFWELVGLCSYFLIGFWFDQEEPPQASMKAFMTNRFGDVGFLLGIFIAYQMFGTLSLTSIEATLRAGDAPGGLWGLSAAQLATLCGLLLFIGPMAKSAQVPMHVWLPDAMAGPTPVSALIHAATMVAAGVYMVGRIYWFFTPNALAFIAIIGTMTAILAATIGLVHNNIKKVLAYSTCSQLGYMMLALGVGGFGAGLFHLYTHAFFKACLFLGAGSVIHAVHTEDMREMGGLRKKMPTTYKTMLIATLALAGVPFFSGAFSKELIIEHALHWGMSANVARMFPALFAIGGAVLTAFYMARLMYLTFFGEPRNQERYDHAHESPPSMGIPLLVLATLSVVSVGWPIWLLGGKAIPKLLPSPPSAIGVALPELDAPIPVHPGPLYIAASAALAVVILVVSWRLFKRTYLDRYPGPDHYATKYSGIYSTLSGLYFFDEFYQATVVRFGWFCSRTMTWFDQHVVDAAVNGVGRVNLQFSALNAAFDRVVVDGLVNFWWHLSHRLSRVFRRLQTGNVQDYLTFAVGGVVLVTLIVFLSQ